MIFEIPNPAPTLNRLLPTSWRKALETTKRWLPAGLLKDAVHRGFRKLIARANHWDAEELRDHRIRQLRKVLIRAGNECPHYRRAFAQARFRAELVQEPADLRDCPILERSQLESQLQDLISPETRRGKRQYLNSDQGSGICLRPTEDLPRLRAFWESLFEPVGFAEAGRVVFIGEFEPDAIESGHVRVGPGNCARLLLDSRQLSPDSLRHQAPAILDFRPDFIVARASAIAALTRFLAETNQSWDLPLGALICGDNRTDRVSRTEMEAVFRCRVVRWYESAEFAALAVELADGSGFEFHPLFGLVELAAPLEHGLREIVATPFHSLTMPLIRYRTGDFVRLPADGQIEKWTGATAAEIVSLR